MQFDSLVPHFLLFLSNYKYILLFFSIIIEGPILMIASGFLILTGFFNPIYAFLVILVGDLVGDVIWYYIGYFFAEPFLKKYGKFFKITPEIFEKSKNLFHKYHEKILFFSKITIGLGISLATLLTAGASHISFRKYIMLNFLGEIVLVSMLLSIGYFFGQMYFSIADTFKVYFTVGTILFVGTFLFYLIRYLRRKIIV